MARVHPTRARRHDGRRMPLKKAEVTGWCTCSCDGSCSGDAIQTLGEPKSGDPRLATLKPYVVPGGPVCRDCVRGRSKLWEALSRRVRMVAPSLCGPTQKGYKDIVNALDGEDAAFLEYLKKGKFPNCERVPKVARSRCN